jgi:hypothetical protein
MIIQPVGGLATEASMGAIAARTTSDGSAVLIGGTQKKYRREFNDPTFADWDVSVGAGMTANATNGSLVITTGTTINSTTSFTSKETFSAPFKAGFGFQISQKIANQEFYVEVVAVDKTDGYTPDETVVAAWRIAFADSATTTIARYEVRNGGAARVQSANTTTEATQTVPAIYEIVLESDEVWFHSRTADGSVARFTSYVKQTTAPDPNRRYRLRYRVVNLGTAPASSTTFTASHLTCIDYTELQAEITGGTGSISGAQAVPVYATGGSVAVTATTIQAAATVAGTTIAKVAAAASTNATLLKASAARIYGYEFTNLTAATKFVKFFNKATAPVAGTDVPVFIVAIPPNAYIEESLTVPVAMATGLGYTITNGVADTDTTAVAANDVVGRIDWI